MTQVQGWAVTPPCQQHNVHVTHGICLTFAVNSMQLFHHSWLTHRKQRVEGSLCLKDAEMMAAIACAPLPALPPEGSEIVPRRGSAVQRDQAEFGTPLRL